MFPFLIIFNIIKKEYTLNMGKNLKENVFYWQQTAAI